MSDAVLQTLINAAAGVAGTLITIGIPAYVTLRSIRKKVDAAREEVVAVREDVGAVKQQSERNGREIGNTKKAIALVADEQRRTQTMVLSKEELQRMQDLSEETTDPAIGSDE